MFYNYNQVILYMWYDLTFADLPLCRPCVYEVQHVRGGACHAALLSGKSFNRLVKLTCMRIFYACIILIIIYILSLAVENAEGSWPCGT